MIEGYLQENGLVYFKIPYGTNLITPQGIIKGSYGGAEMIVDKDHLGEIKQFNEVPYCVGYLNSYGETISVEEYERKKALLLKKAKDFCKGEPVFDDVQDEVNFLIFLKTHRALMETKTHTWPFEYTIKGEEPKEIPYITPVRKVTGDLTNTLYRYSRVHHASELVRLFLLEKGFNQVFDEPKLDRQFWIKAGSLEFAKFRYQGESHYITIKIPALKHFEKGYTATGTSEFLIALRDETERVVSLEMTAWNNRNSIVEGIMLGETISCLSAIRKAVAELDVKIKSDTSKQSVIRQIDKMLGRLKSFENEPN